MICQNCKLGGDFNVKGHIAMAESYHKLCSKCECQHQVGSGWMAVKKPLPPKR